MSLTEESRKEGDDRVSVRRGCLSFAGGPGSACLRMDLSFTDGRMERVEDECVLAAEDDKTWPPVEFERPRRTKSFMVVNEPVEDDGEGATLLPTCEIAVAEVIQTGTSGSKHVVVLMDTGEL